MCTKCNGSTSGAQLNTAGCRERNAPPAHTSSRSLAFGGAVALHTIVYVVPTVKRALTPSASDTLGEIARLHSAVRPEQSTGAAEGAVVAAVGAGAGAPVVGARVVPPARVGAATWPETPVHEDGPLIVSG